jgi:hypothetical protein
LLKEIAGIEQQNQQQAQVQQQTAQILQQLAIEGQRASIDETKMQTQERQSQVIENTVDAAYGRAKTMGEINDLQNEGRLKLLTAAIELEKLRVRKIEVNAKTKELGMRRKAKK